MNRWFRMYDEVLDDPKVQGLSPEDFRGWVNLLCLTNKNGGRLPPIEDISFCLRLPIIDAGSLVDRLRIASLIDTVKGGTNGSAIAPHGWSKRQYKSDGSTERVKRFRNASKSLHETGPEAEAEADNKPLGKPNGHAPDSDAEFWSNAKAYLGTSKASLIGKWARDHGKEMTAQAISVAQIARPPDKVAYIEGFFRKQKNGHAAEWESPC